MTIDIITAYNNQVTHATRSSKLTNGMKRLEMNRHMNRPGQNIDRMA